MYRPKLPIHQVIVGIVGLHLAHPLEACNESSQHDDLYLLHQLHAYQGPSYPAIKDLS